MYYIHIFIYVLNSNSPDEKKKILATLKSDMAISMEKEIKQLEYQSGSLEKTINTLKGRVREESTGDDYKKWLKHIDEVAKKLKQKYSNENNGKYNHYYRMNKNYGNIWENIVCEVNYISNSFESIIENAYDEEKGDMEKEKNEGKGERNNEEKKTKEREEIELSTGKCEKRKIKCNEENEKKKMKRPADELVPISDEELSDGEGESNIINNVVTIDEIGDVEMNHFQEYMEKLNEIKD